MLSTLVVTDLDGTLWGNELTCHRTSLAALDELEAAGIPVLVATGRRAGSARPALAANGLTLPSVLLNGALGIDFVTEHRFHERAFNPPEAAAVLERFASAGLRPCVYLADGRVAVSAETSTSATHFGALGDDALIDDLVGIGERLAVLCFSILGIPEAELTRVLGLLESLPWCEVASYADHLHGHSSVMVQPPGISKWVGIQAWLDHSGHRPDRIVVVGDGGNDLEMLAAADVAVVVDGGDDRALALADHVIARPDDGGWAQVLDLL